MARFDEVRPPHSHMAPDDASGRLGHRHRRRSGERVIEPGLSPFSSCWPPRRRWPRTILVSIGAFAQDADGRGVSNSAQQGVLSEGVSIFPRMVDGTITRRISCCPQCRMGAG